MSCVLTNSSLVCVQTLCARQTAIFAEQACAAMMEIAFFTTKKHGRKANESFLFSKQLGGRVIFTTVKENCVCFIFGATGDDKVAQCGETLYNIIKTSMSTTHLEENYGQKNLVSLFSRGW